MQEDTVINSEEINAEFVDANKSDQQVNSVVDLASLIEQKWDNNAIILGVIIWLLDLGENIFTIFFFSSRFSIGFVFLSFILVGFVKSFSTQMSACGCKVTPHIYDIAMEVLEGVIYTYFCDFVLGAKIFFGIMIGIQSIVHLYELMFTEDFIEKNDDASKVPSEAIEDGELSPEAKEMTEGCAKVCTSNFTAAIIGANSLLYAFTTSNSPFNDYWFQVVLTVYICICIESSNQALDFSLAYPHLTVEINAVNGIFTLSLNMCLGLVVFCIAVPYLQQGPETDYDYAICVISIFGGSVFFCYVCIGLCYFMSGASSMDLNEGNEIDPEIAKRIAELLERANEVDEENNQQDVVITIVSLFYHSYS
jgi:hypothetical protein